MRCLKGGGGGNASDVTYQYPTLFHFFLFGCWLGGGREGEKEGGIEKREGENIVDRYGLGSGELC